MTTGPFESEAEVRALPAVQAVYAAFDADPGAGKMAPHNHELLCRALSEAGVELGAYDHRIALWLATWEPQTVAVVAGWVERANQATAARADELPAQGRHSRDELDALLARHRHPSGENRESRAARHRVDRGAS